MTSFEIIQQVAFEVERLLRIYHRNRLIEQAVLAIAQKEDKARIASTIAETAIDIVRAVIEEEGVRHD